MTFFDFEKRLQEGTWLLDLQAFDRRATLHREESRLLAHAVPRKLYGFNVEKLPDSLQTLVQPVQMALSLIKTEQTDYNSVAHERAGRRSIHLLLERSRQLKNLYWGWSLAQWITSINSLENCEKYFLLVVAYLLTGFTAFEHIRHFSPSYLARIIFGEPQVDDFIQRLQEALTEGGYANVPLKDLRPVVSYLQLFSGDANLQGIRAEHLETLHEHIPSSQHLIAMVWYGLFHLGLVNRRPLFVSEWRKYTPGPSRASVEGVHPEWVSWCERWLSTTTLSFRARREYYWSLLRAGRWLMATHPELTSPEQWTRDLAVEYVAAVDRMQVGDWTGSRPRQNVGKPLSPYTKVEILAAIRVFFSDCQAWQWLPARFDPHLCFATPRTVSGLMTPSPRIVQDDMWAKLLWAGLNLSQADLTGRKVQEIYPLEMLRALAITWLFAGLRLDEILRLRVGCVRWQQGEAVLTSAPETTPRNAACLLEVPAHKLHPPFAKPVDSVVGEAIQLWERRRPTAPALLDEKVGEEVHYLFVYRRRYLGRQFLNRHFIPLLCDKAGVPLEDAGGRITTHRARSTIASQLANAPEPMTLLELKEWLGHHSLQATRHYVSANPTRVAKAYENAGYFARHVRTIQVLLDQEAIQSGAASRGEPWIFYDLGHGFCTYDFFSQCPHRMACAKCAFYLPKESSYPQLIEARASLQRMLQSLPLQDDERAAVEDDLKALEKLQQKLLDTPTPAGPTPRQLKERGPTANPTVSSEGSLS